MAVLVLQLQSLKCPSTPSAADCNVSALLWLMINTTDLR